ncbi:MAG TPA: peptidoglycan recognition family protein, partial [Polyangiaceae bacterium]|nr:peptidoglycan recognition family protein [Polyangiaceae bacterium]
MSFSRGNDLLRYKKVTSHFVIAPNGAVGQLHPLNARLSASHGFNSRSVAIEFAGNLQSAKKRWWRPDEFGRDYLTPAQVESGRRLLRHLHTLGVRYVFAHRQSFADRQNDPGPEIWSKVGEHVADAQGVQVPQQATSRLDLRWCEVVPPELIRPPPSLLRRLQVARELDRHRAAVEPVRRGEAGVYGMELAHGAVGGDHEVRGDLLVAQEIVAPRERHLMQDHGIHGRDTLGPLAFGRLGQEVDDLELGRALFASPPGQESQPDRGAPDHRWQHHHILSARFANTRRVVRESGPLNRASLAAHRR